MVTEVTDTSIIGSAIQAAFVWTHKHTLPTPPYPFHTRVHGPTGEVEFWMTLHWIRRAAQSAGHDVGASAISARIRNLDIMPVAGVQFEQYEGRYGAWG